MRARTLALLLLHAPLAQAQSRSELENQLIDRRLLGSWQSERVRPFAATMLDTGYLYVRPRAMIGYGRPFDRWVGVEGSPLVQSQGAAAYAGVRVEIPHFDLRVGGRYFYSFQRSYVRPDTRYDRFELDSTALTTSRTLTLEAEANAHVPLGPGVLLALGSLSYVGNVPKGAYVYEETLRVMVAPPWVIRFRAGYMFNIGKRSNLRVGPAVDVLGVPERHSHVVRVGVLMRVLLSRSFELRGTFVPTVYSQDRLGLLESDFTELGLRWRWATGP